MLRLALPGGSGVIVLAGFWGFYLVLTGAILAVPVAEELGSMCWLLWHQAVQPKTSHSRFTPRSLCVEVLLNHLQSKKLARCGGGHVLKMLIYCVKFTYRITSVPFSVLDCSPILSSFQVILLEHIIMCRLVTGHKATALQEVKRAVHCFPGWGCAR